MRSAQCSTVHMVSFDTSLRLSGGSFNPNRSWSFCLTPSLLFRYASPLLPRNPKTHSCAFFVTLRDKASSVSKTLQITNKTLKKTHVRYPVLSGTTCAASCRVSKSCITMTGALFHNVSQEERVHVHG